MTHARTTEELPDEWGVQRRWTDAQDRVHDVPVRTVERIRELIGAPPADLEDRAPIVTRRGRQLPSGLGSVRVACEDGTTREVEDRVPDDFPLGYHVLSTAGGTERRLIVSPGRCWLPEQQSWGWAVQLYAARSQSSWGVGDLGDLRALRTWTEQLGGGFLLVNPLHAVAPVAPQEASPYLPDTRRFRNPLYLDVTEVPGFSATDVDDAKLATVNAGPLVDRDEVWELKRPALQAAYHRSAGHDDPDFTTWRREQGQALEEFAAWAALCEAHGPDWHTWPEALTQPHSPAVAEFRREHQEVVDLHAWLQWQLDRQLRAAAGSLTVIQDLPIGVSGGGADSWVWQDTLAQDVSVGAPPDALNTLGQDWGSPPLVPWRLREAGYEPFVESVRATIAGAGGLRIDHVMGLFRLWWIPDGEGPSRGAYVHYPSDDLLDIVALESHRARAVVVGEDLGTVEPSVTDALSERGILSYKVLWFEDDDPAQWPRAALATVTTHDLPTVAGLWTGSDAREQLAVTQMPEDDVRSGREELRAKLVRAGLEEDASAQDAVEAAYAELGRTSSLLVALSLEDAVLEERRPNVPGTVERENWRIPLSVPVDRLADDPGVVRLVRHVSEVLGGSAAGGERPGQEVS